MRESLLYIVVWVLLCSGCGRSYPDEIVLAERIIKEKPDSALSFLNSIKHEINKKPIDIQMYYNLLLVKASDKSYELHTSDSLIKQVVLYYKEKNDYEKLITAYYYLGRVYMDMRETPRALDAFQKAVEISSDEQNSDILGLIYNQLANLYAYQDIFDVAEKMQNKAYDCFKLANDSLAIPYALRNIGRILNATERSDSAIIYYEKAYEAAVEVGSDKHKVVIAGELASLYLKSGDYVKAGDILHIISKYPISCRNLAQYYNNWGDYYFQESSMDSAVSYYQKSIAYNNLYAKPHSYWRLYEINKKAGDYSQMVENLVRYSVSLDSVQTIKKEETIRKLRAMYDFHRMEKENDKLRDMTNMQRSWIFFILIVVLLVGIIYFQYNLRQKIRMRELKAKLTSLHKTLYEKSVQCVDDNNREIERLKYLLEQSSLEKDGLEHQLLIAKKEKLVQLNNHIESEQKEHVILVASLKRTEIYAKCYSALKSNSVKLTQTDWSELQKLVDRTYDNFAERLFVFYPSMSKIEFNICLLIKIGLPVSAISRLVCRTPSAISMCRKQLYKKLFNKEGTPVDFDSFIVSF